LRKKELCTSGDRTTEHQRRRKTGCINPFISFTLLCLFSHVFYGVYIIHTKHPSSLCFLLVPHNTQQTHFPLSNHLSMCSCLCSFIHNRHTFLCLFPFMLIVVFSVINIPSHFSFLSTCLYLCSYTHPTNTALCFLLHPHMLIICTVSTHNKHNILFVLSVPYTQSLCLLFLFQTL
jgi:hypothetical protein